MTRIFKKVQRDKNEEVLRFLESNLPSQEINKENVIYLLYRTHRNTHTHRNRVYCKMTTTTRSFSYSSSLVVSSSIRENKKMGKYSNKKIGIPKTRKKTRRGGKSRAITVFAFAYDDVFSIVKRPYATREPMSSEDEQIWQKMKESKTNLIIMVVLLSRDLILKKLL